MRALRGLVAAAVIVLAAAWLLFSFGAHSEPPLTPFPGPLGAFSSAPVNLSGAGVVFGSCASTNRVAYWTAATTISCSANLTFDGTTFSSLGATVIGDATADTLSITAGAWTYGSLIAVTQTPGLGFGDVGVNYTEHGTALAADGRSYAQRIDYTTSVGGSTAIHSGQTGFHVEMIAGQTGDQGIYAGTFEGNVAGTGSNLNLDNTTQAPKGNFGLLLSAYGTTTGLNVGAIANPEGGNINIGFVGSATVAKNSAENVGGAFYAYNTGTTPVVVGATIALTNADGVPLPATSGALFVDNGNVAAPVLTLRDNGGPVAVVGDGGPVSLTPVASASTLLAMTGASGQTGDYLAMQAEDDVTPRWRILPNGTSGSMEFSWRPILTGSVADIFQAGSSGDAVIRILSSGALQIYGPTVTTNAMTFSAIAPDITTGVNEDLTIDANGSGTTIISDNTTVSLDLAVNGGDLTTTAATMNIVSTNATTVNIADASTTFNMAGGSGSTGCTIDGSGNLTCAGTVSGGGGTSSFFVNGGNSFAAAAILGTNDANSLSFETNNTTYLTIASGGGFTLPVDTNWTITGGVNGFSIDGTTFSVDGANNYIGVGTAAPVGALTVSGATDPLASIEVDETDNGHSATLYAFNTAGGSLIAMYAAGTGVGGTFMGVTQADAAELFSQGASNVLIGALPDVPVVFGNNNTERFRIATGGTLSLSTSILPSADATYSIGDNTHRVNDVRAVTVTTGDLIMRDEKKGAAWRFIEEADRITVIDENTGRKFHLVMEEE